MIQAQIGNESKFLRAGDSTCRGSPNITFAPQRGGVVTQPTRRSKDSGLAGNLLADPPISLRRLLPRLVPAQLSGPSMGPARSALPCHGSQTNSSTAFSPWPMHQIGSIFAGPCHLHCALDIFPRLDKL